MYNSTKGYINQTQELLALTTVNTAGEKRERVFCRSFIVSVIFTGASLVAQMVQNLPAMQETRVQSLGQEDTLEKGMATHSSILAHGQSSLVSYSPWDHKESDMTERIST